MLFPYSSNLYSCNCGFPSRNVSVLRVCISQSGTDMSRQALPLKIARLIFGNIEWKGSYAAFPSLPHQIWAALPFSTLPLLIHWGLSWLLGRVRGSGGRLVCSSVNSILREFVIWLLKGEVDYSRGVFEKPVSERNGWQEKALRRTKKSCWQCLWCNPKRLDTSFCSLGVRHKGAEMLRWK